jgi:hypothetical protein
MYKKGDATASTWASAEAIEVVSSTSTLITFRFPETCSGSNAICATGSKINIQIIGFKNPYSLT